MDRIVALAERTGAWILADEVYQGAERLTAGIVAETPSFWGRGERVLVTNSLSKAYGLPGLRLGWVVGPPDAVDDLWGRTDYTTTAPATLSDHLATLALTPDTRARILARTRKIIAHNLGALTAWLEPRAALLRYRPPDAGAICYVRYDAPVGSNELAERLRVEQDVLVVPGDHFGMEPYLRLGFGLPEADLREALDRIWTGWTRPPTPTAPRWRAPTTRSACRSCCAWPGCCARTSRTSMPRSGCWRKRPRTPRRPPIRACTCARATT
jgi:aspartate/methionine/tyrosine aminotransferase